MKSVLLLETVSPEPFRHHRADRFPFLLGLLRGVDWPTQWWAIPEPVASATHRSRFVATMTDDVLALLDERLSAWRPEVVVANNRPDDALRAVLRGTAGRTRVVTIDGADNIHAESPVREICQLLFGGSGPEELRTVAAPLVDHAAPVFARELLAPLAEHLRDVPTRLLGRERLCAYRKPVANNPCYGDLDEEQVKDRAGCTFCASRLQGRGDGGPALKTSVLELTLRQIESHQSALPRGDKGQGYLVEDVGFHHKLVRSLETLVERIQTPTTIYTMLRADSLCATQERLRQVLPLMAERGHALRLLSIGAENFSQPENDRFNKGLTIETLWDCHGALSALEREFPGTFACVEEGHFVGILFTPWTELQDLEANALAARALGEPFLKRMLGSRLQLFRGAAITRLATHDGLTCEDEGDTGDLVAICLSSESDSEIPWRFRNPATRTVAQLLVRLELSATQSRIPEDDPLVARVQAWRRSLPSLLGKNQVELVITILEVAKELGDSATIETIMAGVTQRTAAEERWFHENRKAPWMRWMRSVLTSRAIPPARLRGYELREDLDHAKPEEPLMRFALSKDGDVFRFRVRERRGERKVWLTSERFELEHDGSTPPKNTDERQLAEFVLRMLSVKAPTTSV